MSDPTVRRWLMEHTPLEPTLLEGAGFDALVAERVATVARGDASAYIDALATSWRGVLLAIGAVLIARAASIYLLVPASNLLAETISARWQHVLVWGGLRGALALALALSLDSTIPSRDKVLDLTFGVVIFSILVQGLTIKALLRLLGLADDQHPKAD